jgi:hypothetical protein
MERVLTGWGGTLGVCSPSHRPKLGVHEIFLRSTPSHLPSQAVPPVPEQGCRLRVGLWGPDLRKGERQVVNDNYFSPQ